MLCVEQNTECEVPGKQVQRRLSPLCEVICPRCGGKSLATVSVPSLHRCAVARCQQTFRDICVVDVGELTNQLRAVNQITGQQVD